MATPKYSGIKFGPGAINNLNGESAWFIEQREPLDGTPGTVDWNAITTYNVGDAVVFNYVSYNSIVPGNFNNQPDISPLSWAPVDGKDGDVWIALPPAGFPAGGDADFHIKSNNRWVSMANAPTTVSLTDGQLVPTYAIEFPASIFYKATLEYTVRRGAGHGRVRRGKFEILNDGSSPAPVYSHEFNEIGADVNVPFSVDLSGGNVRILYTSVLEGVAIQLKYTLTGWI